MVGHEHLVAILDLYVIKSIFNIKADPDQSGHNKECGFNKSVLFMKESGEF